MLSFFIDSIGLQPPNCTYKHNAPPKSLTCSQYSVLGKPEEEGSEKVEGGAYRESFTCEARFRRRRRRRTSFRIVHRRIRTRSGGGGGGFVNASGN